MFEDKLYGSLQKADEAIRNLNTIVEDKTLGIDGYKDGNIIDLKADGTGTIQAQDGSTFNFKSDTKAWNSAVNNPYETAMYTGKQVNDLTEQDFANVDAYKRSELLNKTVNPSYTASAYDSSRDYTSDILNPLPVKYKADTLADLEIRNTTFAGTTSPKLSSSLQLTNEAIQLYKGVNPSPANRLAEYANAQQSNLQNIIKETFLDTDGRLGELVDQFQSASIQMLAHLLSPAPFVDQEYWQQFRDHKTGQERADIWAGVKSSTREDMTKAIQEGETAFKEGRYLDSVISYASQIDRTLADSLPQMLGIVAGTTVGAALGSNPLGLALAGTLVATDMTSRANEEYKANNNEQSMSYKDLLGTFAGHFALALPEALVTKVLGSNVTNAFKQSITKKYSEDILTSLEGNTASKIVDGIKTVLGSAILEGTQEVAQDTLSTYMGQSEDSNLSLADVLTQDSNISSFMLGALTGGALSGVSVAGTNTLNALSRSKRLNNLENESIFVEGLQREEPDVDQTTITNHINNINSLVTQRNELNTQIPNETDANAVNVLSDNLNTINQGYEDYLNSLSIKEINGIVSSLKENTPTSLDEEVTKAKADIARLQERLNEPSIQESSKKTERLQSIIENKEQKLTELIIRQEEEQVSKNPLLQEIESKRDTLEQSVLETLQRPQEVKLSEKEIDDYSSQVQKQIDSLNAVETSTLTPEQKINHEDRLSQLRESQILLTRAKELVKNSPSAESKRSEYLEDFKKRYIKDDPTNTLDTLIQERKDIKTTLSRDDVAQEQKETFSNRLIQVEEEIKTTRSQLKEYKKQQKEIKKRPWLRKELGIPEEGSLEAQIQDLDRMERERINKEQKRKFIDPTIPTSQDARTGREVKTQEAPVNVGSNAVVSSPALKTRIGEVITRAKQEGEEVTDEDVLSQVSTDDFRTTAQAQAIFTASLDPSSPAEYANELATPMFTVENNKLEAHSPYDSEVLPPHLRATLIEAQQMRVINDINRNGSFANNEGLEAAVSTFVNSYNNNTNTRVPSSGNTEWNAYDGIKASFYQNYKEVFKKQKTPVLDGTVDMKKLNDEELAGSLYVSAKAFSKLRNKEFVVPKNIYNDTLFTLLTNITEGLLDLKSKKVSNQAFTQALVLKELGFNSLSDLIATQQTTVTFGANPKYTNTNTINTPTGTTIEVDPLPNVIKFYNMDYLQAIVSKASKSKVKVNPKLQEIDEHYIDDINKIIDAINRINNSLNGKTDTNEISRLTNLKYKAIDKLAKLHQDQLTKLEGFTQATEEACDPTDVSLSGTFEYGNNRKFQVNRTSILQYGDTALRGAQRFRASLSNMTQIIQSLIGAFDQDSLNYFEYKHGSLDQFVERYNTANQRFSNATLEARLRHQANSSFTGVDQTLEDTAWLLSQSDKELLNRPEALKTTDIKRKLIATGSIASATDEQLTQVLDTLNTSTQYDEETKERIKEYLLDIRSLYSDITPLAITQLGTQETIQTTTQEPIQTEEQTETQTEEQEPIQAETQEELDKSIVADFLKKFKTVLNYKSGKFDFRTNTKKALLKLFTEDEINTVLQSLYNNNVLKELTNTAYKTGREAFIAIARHGYLNNLIPKTLVDKLKTLSTKTQNEVTNLDNLKKARFGKVLLTTKNNGTGIEIVNDTLQISPFIEDYLFRSIKSLTNNITDEAIMDSVKNLELILQTQSEETLSKIVKEIATNKNFNAFKTHEAITHNLLKTIQKYVVFPNNKTKDYINQILKVRSTDLDTITSFQGTKLDPNSFILSQGFEYNGIEYPSLRHAIEAARVTDLEQKKEIANARTPQQAREIAFNYTKDKAQESFQRITEELEDIVKARFNTEGYKKALLDTGNTRLIYGTLNDPYLGATKEKYAFDYSGQNLLGHTLENTRAILQREQQPSLQEQTLDEQLDNITDFELGSIIGEIDENTGEVFEEYLTQGIQTESQTIEQEETQTVTQKQIEQENIIEEQQTISDPEEEHKQALVQAINTQQVETSPTNTTIEHSIDNLPSSFLDTGLRVSSKGRITTSSNLYYEFVSMVEHSNEGFIRAESEAFVYNLFKALNSKEDSVISDIVINANPTPNSSTETKIRNLIEALKNSKEINLKTKTNTILNNVLNMDYSKINLHSPKFSTSYSIIENLNSLFEFNKVDATKKTLDVDLGSIENNKLAQKLGYENVNATVRIEENDISEDTFIENEDTEVSVDTREEDSNGKTAKKDTVSYKILNDDKINEDVKKYLLKQYKATAGESLFAKKNPFKDTPIMKRLMDVANRIDVSRASTSKDILKKWIYDEEQPAIPIIYKVDKNYNLTLNEDVIATIYYSLTEYFTDSNVSKYCDTSNCTVKDFATLFGLKPDKLSSTSIHDIRELVGTYGIPTNILVNGIGRRILKNLGIARNNETSTNSNYSKLAAALGGYALAFLQEESGHRIQLSTVNKSEFGRSLSQDLIAQRLNMTKLDARVLGILRDVYLGFRDQDGIRKYQGLKQYSEVTHETTIATPRIYEKSLDSFENTKVRHGSGYQVSDFNKEVMWLQANQKFVLLTDILDEIQDLIESGNEVVLNNLEIPPEDNVDFSTISDVTSAASKRNSGRKSIGTLLAYNEVQKRLQADKTKTFDGFMFDIFMSKNGRYFYNSDLNPQTNKLHRFLCLPKKAEVEFDPNNETLRNEEAYAIAQAFDAVGTQQERLELLEKFEAYSESDLKRMFKDFLSKNKDEVVKEWSNEIGVELGIENYGQCLVALRHLILKKQSNGKPFKTFLAVENDSTTSGYYLRILQYPLEGVVEEFSEKVGVFTPNNKFYSTNPTNKQDIVEVKTLIEDIYKTFGRSTSNELEEMKKKYGIDTAKNKHEAWRELFYDNITKDKRYVLRDQRGQQLNYIDKLDNAHSDTLDTLVTDLGKTMVLMEDSLPIVKDGKVTSALRKLFKPVVMVFGYGAGAKSIAQQISNTIYEKHVSIFLNYANDKKVQQALKNKESLKKVVNDYVDRVARDEDSKKEILSVLRVFEKLRKLTNDDPNNYLSLANRLKNEFAEDIILTITKPNSTAKVYLNIKAYYDILLQYSYGAASQEALNKSFKDYVKINEVIIHYTQKAGDLFVLTRTLHLLRKAIEKGYTKGLTVDQLPEIVENIVNDKDRTEAYNESIYTSVNKVIEDLYADSLSRLTTQDVKEVDEAIRSLVPGTAPVTTTDATQGIVFFDTERDKSSLSRTQTSYWNPSTNALQRITVFGEQPRYTNAGVAPAVMSVHMQDGFIMGLTIKEMIDKGFIGVHDALVSSAFVAKDIAQYYNKVAPLVTKEYPMYSDIMSRCLLLSTKAYDSLPEIRSVIRQESTIESNKSNSPTKQASKYWVQVTKARREFYGNPFVSSNMSGNEVGTVIYPSDTLAGQVDPRLKRILQRVKEDYDKASDKLQEKLASQELHTIPKSNEKLWYRRFRSFGDNPIDIARYSWDVVGEIANNDDSRIKLLDMIQLKEAIDGITTSPEMDTHYRELLSRVKPNNLKNIIVRFAESNSGINEGEYDYNMNPSEKDRLYILSNVQKAKDSYFQNKSLSEIYTHEVIHSVMKYAEGTSNTYYRVSNYFQDIHRLMQRAQEHITWEDFLPETTFYKQQEAEEYAKFTYDYIFGIGRDRQGNDKVAEFVSYALTNETLMNKLKEIPVMDIAGRSMKFTDRLIRLVKGLFDFIFGNTKLNEVANLSYELFKNTSRNRDNIYNELDKLVVRLSKIDHTVGKRLYIRDKFLLAATEALADAGTKVGDKLKDGIEYVTTLGEKFKLPLRPLYSPTASIPRKALSSAAFLATCVISKNRRTVLRNTLANICKNGHASSIMSFFRDFNKPDEASYELEHLLLQTRLIDQSSKAIESSVQLDIQEAFGRDLNDMEAKALTRAFLRTDLQSLDLKELNKVLTDESYVASEIDKIKQSLPKQYLNYIHNHSLALARYMVTGQGTYNLRTNATRIVQLHPQLSKIADTNLENTIDRLITLYAIQMTDTDSKTTVANLETKGIQTIHALMKEYWNKVKESQELEDTQINEELQALARKRGFTNTLSNTLTSSSNYIKGYTKSLIEPLHETTVGLKKDSKLLKKEGFKQIATINKDLAIYRRTLSLTNRRDGAGFVLAGQMSMRNTLLESAFSMDSENNTVDLGRFGNKTKLDEATIQNLTNESKKYYNAMERRFTQKELTIEDLDKFNEINAIPIYDMRLGSVTDFAISLNNDLKESVLDTDIRADNIIAAMYAAQNTQLSAKERNQALLAFLEQDMNTNMNPKTKTTYTEYTDEQTGWKGTLDIGKLSGIPYIALSDQSTNEFVKKGFKYLPSDIKRMLKNRSTPLLVREDWAMSLLGIPTGSVTQIQALNKVMNPIVRYAVITAESIVKAIAYLAKVNIVFKTPAVLIGNIVSNLMYSIMHGYNPKKVFSMTLKNAKELRDYIDTKKEYNKLLLKERIKTATKEEITRKKALYAKLEASVLHPLMVDGFFNSILEDVNPDNIESLGLFGKMLKSNKIVNKIPKPLQTIGRHLYMTSGTPIFDFMFTITQYSDFIARATHYQLMMEKAPTQYEFITDSNGNSRRLLTKEYQAYEAMVKQDILNAFINYDKPSTSIETYLNDLGLVMFTKYAKRIQHVIVKFVTENPIKALLLLLTQFAIYDTSDILEANAISRDWSNLVYNPIDNLQNALVPIPVQALFNYDPYRD